MNGDREAQFWEDMRTAKEDDAVSRQMALDKIAEYFGDLRIVAHHDMLQLIKDLPSASRDAEIVRCKDCKHHEDESPGMVYCPNQVGGWVSDDFFCADGRRDDG